MVPGLTPVGTGAGDLFLQVRGHGECRLCRGSPFHPGWSLLGQDVALGLGGGPAAHALAAVARSLGTGGDKVGSSSVRVLGVVHGAWAAAVPPWGTAGGELPALPRVAAGGCPLGRVLVDLRLLLPALWSHGAELAAGIAVGSPPVGAHGHQALLGARGSVGMARSRLSHLLTAPSHSQAGGDLAAPPGDTQEPQGPVPCPCSFCA